MTSQTMNKNNSVIASFSDRQSAVEAKSTITAAGIPNEKIAIDDYIKPRSQVAAIGTTAGGEAGLWLGLGYGGVLGIIAAAALSFFNGGTLDNSLFNRLVILGIAVAGGVVGGIYGKQLFNARSRKEQQKADPTIPRQFRIVINGSQTEIEQAQQALQ
ncbi:MAG: hypothetical protein F6K04_18415 [Leptolyngbya sp. SIO4C5]|nr:hypothetical protein [Leptolyngbya sp. SIO4C5]